MAELTATRHELNEINGGKRYENGDGVQPDAINIPLELSAYAIQVADEAKLLAELASGTTLNEFVENLLLLIHEKEHPIHSLAIYTDDTNPAELYGGYWLKIEDAFLWCSGSTVSITYTQNGSSVTKSLSAGSRGGEFSHTLTVDEMPSHSHRLAGQRNPVPVGSSSFWDSLTGDNYVDNSTERTIGTGGGQAHNIMPPYYSVNAWVRVTEEEFNANESL